MRTASLRWGVCRVGLTLILCCLASSMVRADSVRVSRECEAAIAEVQGRLEAIPGITNVNIRQIDMSSWRQEYPKERPLRYAFNVRGQSGASNMLNSPKFLTTQADQVIRACARVSAVYFGMDGSDWGGTHGLVGDRVQLFMCYEDPVGRPSGKPVPWGYSRCL